MPRNPELPTLIELAQSFKLRHPRRRRGLITCALAVAIFLNSGFWFPFPVTGLPSVIISALLFVLSLRDLYLGLRLPVREVLLAVFHHGGRLQRGQLEEFLGSEADCLDEVLKVLSDRNWVLRQSDDLQAVFELPVAAEASEQLLLLQDDGRNELERMRRQR